MMFDLNNLLDPASPWQVNGPFNGPWGINDKGEIGVNGCTSSGQCDALLLSPNTTVPEPMTLVLFGSALAALVILRRRKNLGQI